MARTMKNLKIRKFLTMQGYKNADVGEDDLCLVLDENQPLIQVTELPTASEGELDKVYQYIGPSSQYTNGFFYRCYFDSYNNIYYWGQINVQPQDLSYQSSVVDSTYFGSFNLIRFARLRYRQGQPTANYRDTFGILVKIINTDTGDSFYGRAESFGDVRKCRVYKATGIFSDAKFCFYKTQPSSVLYTFGICKTDGSVIDANGGNYYYSVQVYGTWGNASSDITPNYTNVSIVDALPFDELPTTTVNGQSGDVVITPSNIGATPQYLIIPPVLDVSVGSIVQYIGATDATYTNGYFYKNNAVITPSSATISQTSGSDLSDITIDKEVFESMAQPSTGSYVFLYNVYEQITPSEATNWDVTVTILNQATFIAAIKQLLLSQTGSDAFQMVSVNCSRADMSSPTQVNINVSQDNVWWGQLNITPADWGLSVTGEFSGSAGGDHTILHGYYSSSNSWMLSGSPVNISYYGIAYTGTETIGDELTVAYTAASYTGGWDQTDVQPSSGGSSLPSQTGNAGKFLTTDGTDASWSDKPLVNRATGSDSMAIGASSQTSQANSTCVGVWAGSNGAGGVAIGANAYADTPGCVIINSHPNGVRAGNQDSNTFRWQNANGNFMIMDANGNLPADRLASTSGLADGNYRLRCTITNGVPTLSWVAE